MKKLLMITLSLFILSTVKSFAGIKVTIEFGRGTDCHLGFGICSITVGAIARHTMSLSPDGTTLTIGVDASQLKHDQPKILQYLDGKKSVTIEEDWESSAEITRALKSSHPIIIHRGTYPVTSSGGIYTITVKVTPVPTAEMKHINKPMLEKDYPR